MSCGVIDALMLTTCIAASLVDAVDVPLFDDDDDDDVATTVKVDLVDDDDWEEAEAEAERSCRDGAAGGY
jgi:hypothetical protein